QERPNALDPGERAGIVAQVGGEDQPWFGPVLEVAARDLVEDAPAVAAHGGGDLRERDVQPPRLVVVAGDHVASGSDRPRARAAPGETVRRYHRVVSLDFARHRE